MSGYVFESLQTAQQALNSSASTSCLRPLSRTVMVSSETFISPRSHDAPRTIATIESESQRRLPRNPTPPRPSQPLWTAATIACTVLLLFSPHLATSMRRNASPDLCSTVNPTQNFAPRIQRFASLGFALFLGLSMLACQKPPNSTPRPTAQSGSPLHPITDEVASGSSEASEQDYSSSKAAPPPPTPPAHTVDALLDRGSGDFVSDPEPRTSTSFDTRGTGTKINVFNADIRKVVSKILGEGLGVPFTIDPAVQGTITLNTAREVLPDDLLAMLDAVLRLNGAALIQTDTLIKVVPVSQANSRGVAFEVPETQERSAIGQKIEIIPVEFVSAAQLAKLLEPFVSAETSILTNSARNLILLVGADDELTTLRRLATMFDVDWLSGMSFGLFPLYQAPSYQIVEELDQIFAGPLADVIRFFPIDRMNSVLVASSQPEYLERSRLWIDRLDRVAENDSQELFIYEVKYADPAELADGLAQVLREDGTRMSIAPGAGPSVEAESGSGAEKPKLRPSMIFAIPTASSLLIRTTRRRFEELKQILEKLDSVPKQVMIEATILEVTLNDQLQYGVEWFLRFGENDLRFSTTGDVFQRFPGASLLVGGVDARVVVSALEEVSDVKVVSAPHLLVLENETASLQVGEDVPVATQTAVALDGSDNTIVSSITQQSTGTILSVTPKVSSTGLVVLQVDESTSDAIPTQTSGIDSPTIRQRRISSSIAVRSGATVMLGGLIREDAERGRSGIPIFSQIPVVGWLFGRSSSTRSRTELLVLITPRVVGESDEARAVTDELRQKLTEIERLRMWPER